MKVFKGKRSKVYCIFNLAIKIERKDSNAINRIKNEAKVLKIINNHNIGPRLFFKGDSFIVMEYIKGERILDFIVGVHFHG